MTELRASPSTPLPPNARLRFDVVRRLLNDLEDSQTFLEIGCGQGAFAALLADRFDYVGYEPDPASFEVAQARVRGRDRARIVNSPLPEVPDRAFDVVGAFEVLEHLEDDHAALEAWARWLRPGGCLLLSVPANPDRYGPWDSEVGHYRRYRREDLRLRIENAGLTDVTVVACGFPLGYALELVRNRIAARRDGEQVEITQRTAASGRRLQPGIALAPLIWAGTLPFTWLQRPFGAGNLGTGLVARAQKPA